MEANVDVLLVTALTEEQQVVHAVLRDNCAARGEFGELPNKVALYEYTVDETAYFIATACCHEMGAHAMSSFTASLLATGITPASAVLVGIAAAADNADVAVGDVPVASEVLDAADIKLSGGKATFRPHAFHVDQQMRRAAGQLRETAETHTRWRMHCQKQVARVVEELNASGLRSALITIPPDFAMPRMLVELGAGGPFLVADADFVHALRKGSQSWSALHPKVAWVEMEAHGFMKAASNAEVPAIVMKGISDAGDAHKASLEQATGGFFRAYACSNSVLALLHLLAQRPRAPISTTARIGMINAAHENARSSRAHSVPNAANVARELPIRFAPSGRNLVELGSLAASLLESDAPATRTAIVHRANLLGVTLASEKSDAETLCDELHDGLYWRFWPQAAAAFLVGCGIEWAKRFAADVLFVEELRAAVYGSGLGDKWTLLEESIHGASALNECMLLFDERAVTYSHRNLTPEQKEEIEHSAELLVLKRPRAWLAEAEVRWSQGARARAHRHELVRTLEAAVLRLEFSADGTQLNEVSLLEQLSDHHRDLEAGAWRLFSFRAEQVTLAPSTTYDECRAVLAGTSKLLECDLKAREAELCEGIRRILNYAFCFDRQPRYAAQSCSSFANALRAETVCLIDASLVRLGHAPRFRHIREAYPSSVLSDLERYYGEPLIKLDIWRKGTFADATSAYFPRSGYAGSWFAENKIRDRYQAHQSPDEFYRFLLPQMVLRHLRDESSPIVRDFTDYLIGVA